MNPHQSQSLNEVKSLAGKIDTSAMGQKITKQKPSKQKLTEKPKTNRQQGGAASTLNKIEIKGGNILEQKFDETIQYRPKTNESRLIYENFLGKVYQIVEDQPQQTLISIADEILSCLKSQEQNDDQKKLVIEGIIGEKLDQNKFLNFCNIVSQIKDYDVNQNTEYNEAIIMDDQAEGDDEDDEKNQYVREQVPDQDENENEKIVEKVNIKSQMREEQDNNNNLEGQLKISQIDAHWLQKKLSEFYDSSDVLTIEKEILDILSKKVKLEVENGLLTLLNYERYELIKLLLQNKDKVYYLTKYHQTENFKQKEKIKEQMKSFNIVLEKVGKSGATKQQQQSVIKSTKKSKIEEQQDEENINIRFTMAKQEDLLRIPRKKLDLSIHDTSDHTSKKQQYKFKLPQGAQKQLKPGYEEIKIPAKPNKVSTELIQIQTLPEWMQPVFTGIKRFNPIQSIVLQHTLKTNQNMLVCAPTSAGKTNVALLSILEAISNFIKKDGTINLKAFKIVYVAPMKALVAEITGNLSNRLKSLGVTVRELTGDMHLTKSQIQETQVIVSTPQKWDIITRKAGERMFTQKVRLLIIDQIHLLSDSRGPVLESLIARVIRQVENTQQQVRIVGLSATLPNYKDVGLTLRVNPKKGMFYFDQSFRPIPLQQLFIGVTEKKGVRKMMMINEILYEKVIERVANQQIIIFVHSRRDTSRTAKALKESAYTRDELSKILRPESESKSILQAIIEKQTINSADLKQLLAYGIGIHHAGLSRADRDLVEELFSDRHLNILVSTATLAWGVNLPAHTVIIKGTQVYSPEEGRWVEVSLQDITQMLGRAGRPRFDTEGEGIIITGYDEVRYYLGLLSLQVPLESQMLKALPDQLNAQVVLSTVGNIKDAVNWLSYTYLYIRMLKNPKYYSIPLEELQEDPELLKRRVNLAHTAACILQANGLIHYDRRNGSLGSTFLGKIASHYYIKHSSIIIYNSNLKNNSGLIQLFKIFSMSSEFQYLAVREQEKNELKKLVETVPVPIKGSIEESTTKICALLQAYISRLPLDGYALNVDKVYVTQSASRIMRGLFQICLKRGWGQAAAKTLQLSKMIDKSMWNCLNPLRQFKQIPEYVLSRLQKKEQFSWEFFYQMSPQEIGDLTKFPKLGKILYKFVHHIPRVELDAYAQPITRSSLKVQLNVKGDFKWEDEYHGRQEGFWMFVLDCNEDNILFSYYFTLRKEDMNFSMELVVPLFEILHPLYFIKVISDRWISTDNVLPLSFKNIILPQKFSPPTQILDMQPLPGTSLGSLGKLLKITYLNQVQTQVHHSIITDNNVFIGASEGNGKFTMALWSAIKVLQSDRKVVILEPFTEMSKSRFHQLSKLFNQYKVACTFNELTKDILVLASNDVIISTPQAWEVLSRRWKARKGFNEIGLLIVDGIHLVAEEGGSTLEIIVSRMRSIGEEISSVSSESRLRIIGLSASVADYKQVSEWIGSAPEHTYNFHPSVRPNNFELIFSSQDQLMRESRTYMMQKSLFQMIKHYNRNSIIFTNSKKQAKLSAVDFVTLLQGDSGANAKRFLKIPTEQFKALEKKISDRFLLHVLGYGIGYLYKGMNPVEKEIIEKLFQIEAINIIFVQESLKWELEKMRAFIVAVLDSQKYDCKKSRWVDYSICEMIRFMGMSTLTEKDRQKGKEYSSSKFIVLCQSAKKNFYKKFLFEPYPLESSLHTELGDALNSAIVAKTVQTKEQCIDWLSWTFFYRRIVQNPNYYNLQQVTEEGISSYLSELIENTVEYLENIKCVQAQEDEQNGEVQNEGTLTATNLGIICSYYSIKVETLAYFVDKLTENIKLKSLIQLICEAQELSSMTFRPKQYELVNQLLVSLAQSSTRNKPEALIMLHLSRANITEQLQFEVNLVLPIVVKLIHALVDVISCLGYLKPIVLSMQLCQMLIQGMWLNDSALIQIMDKETARKVENIYEIKTVNDFLNMEDNQRQTALLGVSGVQKIAEACNRYPIMNMAANTLPFEQGEDQQLKVQISLARDEQLQSLKVYTEYFPEQKEEYWWVIVGQKKSNRVLTTKRLLIKDKQQITLEFEKIEGADKYVVYALCDSYVGCDQAQEIKFGQSKKEQVVV